MAQLQGQRSRAFFVALLCILAAYACGRLLEVVYGPVPTTALVAVEVLSAGAFALVHGAARYGLRTICVFFLICIIVGNTIENIGVATGFPYGRYSFLNVMGPKIFYVPVLLGLAYIGMAYVSWVLAEHIVGPPLAHTSIFAVPVVASFLMVAWDLAQDPVWSTMLHAWVWYDGGSWFGVPLTNYRGWFLTIFLITVSFALYLRKQGTPRMKDTVSGLPALLLYALCAAGNALQVLVRRTVAESPDGSGHLWRVDDILGASALVSLFVMGGFTAIAGVRMAQSSGATD